MASSRARQQELSASRKPPAKKGTLSWKPPSPPLPPLQEGDGKEILKVPCLPLGCRWEASKGIIGNLERIMEQNMDSGGGLLWVSRFLPSLPTCDAGTYRVPVFQFEVCQGLHTSGRSGQDPGERSSGGG